MASELEGLIATLLVLISCGGEQGCSVRDVVDAIHNPARTQQSIAADVQPPDSGSEFRHRTASTIWKWLVARKDVSVGTDRTYNHLSLDEVLALPLPQNEGNIEAAPISESNADSRQPAHHVSVTVSEETMWESLTGHAIDYKRVPRSEWLLLLGIASTTSHGILQGDLGRLVDQDKRSVPKRTDALLKKGYIAKRTTLVRGTKTSKMWLKMFAPSLAKDGDVFDEPRAEMNLTRQFLVASLDPVPWHVRWTGESVDYTALATTILAVAKEWGVLRMQDLKSKLGVLGMRWQMKVLAKVCRFLNSRGVIQYVAAKLGEKVFKDCIKYARDLNSEDWSIFLATGKRATKPSRNPDLTAGDAADGQPSGMSANPSEVSSSPPWSLDKPLPVSITEMAQRLGDKGLSNPDVYGATLGASFSRYLSSMTSALATPNLQPPNLRHFQLRSEHTRAGKIASYRYFAPQVDPTDEAGTSETASREDNGAASSIPASPYGFAQVPMSAMTKRPMATLANLCTQGSGTRKPKGRPKKAQTANKISCTKENVEVTEGQAQQQPQSPEPAQDPGPTKEDVPPQEPETRQAIILLEDDARQETNDKTQDSDGTGKMATLKVSSSELKALLDQPADETPSRTRTRARASLDESTPDTTLGPRRTRSQRQPPAVSTPTRPRRTRNRAAPSSDGDKENALPGTDEAETTKGDSTNNEVPNGNTTAADATEATNIDTTAPDAAEADVTGTGDGSAKPKKRGGRRRKGGSSEGTGAKPWKCEKCGGAWKNDIGLKYHLEKSRTSCNPSYDETAEPTPRRNRKRPFSEVEDGATGTPAPPGTPGNGKSATGEQLEGEDAVEEGTPAPLRSRRRTVATPKVMSRPSVSLTGGPLQAIPEWRRPPGNGFDSPDKSPASCTNGGPLVQSQAGQLRPALGLSDGRRSGPGTPRLAPNKRQRLEDKLSTEEPQPGARTSEDGGPPESKVARSKVVDSLLPKVTANSRLYEIIKELLEEQDGVFPAGRALWHAVTVRWGEKFPTDGPAPTTRLYQVVLREMVKTKEVTEHLHGFRDSKGFFCKCQMIMLGDKDPFSEEAMNLVERAKEVYPATYIPPPFTPLPATGTVKDLRRGRRQLGEEVETLSAPVYVAQAAAKKMNDQDDMDTAPRPKRRRTKTTNAVSSSTSVKKRYVSWVDLEQPEYMAPPVWTAPADCLMSQKPIEVIEFLDPNTFLQDDPTSKPWKRRRYSGYVESDECVIDPQLMSGDATCCAVFDKIHPLVDLNGTWPYMSIMDFEMEGGSYTLEGWMPDANWFSWAEIVEDIERRTMAIERARRRTETDASPYEQFKDRTAACLEAERAWSDFFTSAPRNSAGPHNILVKFLVGRDTTVFLPLESSTWAEGGQLSLDSAVLSAQDEEEEDSDESSVSDDEHPFKWPKLRLPVVKPTKSSAAAETPIRVDPLARGNTKRVRLVARDLTSLPPATQDTEDTQEPATASEDKIDDPDKLLAAFISVRVLLGGADKAVDWGLLLKLFPKLGVTELRRFWLSARKEQGAYVAKLTKDFQDRFLVAYEKDELPEIDFNDIVECDWEAIITWAMRLRRRVGVQLPSTRQDLKEQFSSQDVPVSEDDWREKFHHPQSSVFSRFEASTAAPAAVSVHRRGVEQVDQRSDMTNLDITRSWIRSLCCTDETRYSPFQIKEKFSKLANGDAEENNRLLRHAIADLTHQRVICKSKKPPLGGRPYRLNESYSYTLAKLAQQEKYQQAFAFKAKLDAAFRRDETMKVPYTLDDGSVMALTNLNASGRVRLVPVDVPNIPMGFEPGNYESRKYPKSYYHFGIEVAPTERYRYNEEIDVLRLAAGAGPPLEGPQGELPQWIDFFGQRDVVRWTRVLGAFCFVYATRGLLTVEGICSALRPVLEEFEAWMIIDWGKRTGVLRDAEEGMGIMVGEWWWLAVPWQSQKHVASREGGGM